MRSKRFYIHKLKTVPLHKIVITIARKSGQILKKGMLQIRDFAIDTRGGEIEGEATVVAIKKEALDLAAIDRDMAAQMLRLWQAHRFDLLGSGWVEVAFKDNAPGLFGIRYVAPSINTDNEGQFLKKVLPKQCVKKSRMIWREISEDYQAIDWQKDFKTGYRWSAKEWYRPQRMANRPGGDIKVPWELARLQHLPRMALFSFCFPEKRAEIAKQFCDQCLDFFAQNPTRWGVNWVCTMDVGIRAANIVLAYSIFQAAGVEFSKKFRDICYHEIYGHCGHIYRNLEWSEVLTSNHYLANVVGLLYGAYFVKKTRKGEKWLEFAKEECINEIRKQFHKEGSNFEGSIAYHRLSGEMAVYALALLENQRVAIPVDVANRIFCAGKFMQALTGPDGTFVQIGDNDSGMFFRLSPTGCMRKAAEAVEIYESLSEYTPLQEDEFYPDEEMNDGRPFISALNGLFQTGDHGSYPLEYSMIVAVANVAMAYGEGAECIMEDDSNKKIYPSKWAMRESRLSFCAESIIEVQGKNCRKGETSLLFMDFGVWVYRSDRIYLVANMSENGQNGNAGHAHNDKLSFSLAVDGEWWLTDPGTAVYTAFPEKREAYRSIKAHNTIYAGVEQNIALSIFSLQDDTRCTIKQLNENSIRMRVEYHDIVHERTIIVFENEISILDRCNREFFANKPTILQTKGYGKVLRKK